MNAPALRARTCAIVVGVVGFAVGFLVSAARAAESDHASVATGSSGAPATAMAMGNAPATAPVNTAIVPQLNPRFESRHAEFVEIAKKGDIDVLFMGDSITDWWRSAGRPGSTPGPETPYAGKPVFEKYFGEWKVANFGIAGDTTQGVLFRLQNGEGTGFQPKVVMLMIGTNNASRNTAAEIAEGVTAVVTELRKDFPAARILLLGIFPRATPDNPVRAKLAEVNATIAKLNDNAHVFYLDIGANFLAADGTIPKSVMSDGLHPTTHGYEIWAEAVKEPLTKLLTLAAP
jgi:lysophospholipase L1-like esterase